MKFKKLKVQQLRNKIWYQVFVRTITNLRVPKKGFLDRLSDCQLPKMTFVSCVELGEKTHLMYLPPVA
jgi:hypothetical protein